jgi:hypothetical protein
LDEATRARRLNASRLGLLHGSIAQQPKELSELGIGD